MRPDKLQFMITRTIFTACLSLFLYTTNAYADSRYSDLVSCLSLGDSERLSCFDRVAVALNQQSGAQGQGAQNGSELMIALINNQMIEDRTSSQIGGLTVSNDPPPPNPTDGSFNLNADRFVQCLLEQNDGVRANCVEQVVRAAWPH